MIRFMSTVIDDIDEKILRDVNPRYKITVTS